MLDAGHDLSFGRAVAGKLVSNHDAWRSHLLLQQLAQQPLGRLLVASALDQDIEDISVLVDRTPKIVLLPRMRMNRRVARGSCIPALSQNRT